MFSVFKRMISGWCSVVRIPRETGAESSEEETISGTPSPPPILPAIPEYTEGCGSDGPDPHRLSSLN